MCNIDPTTVNEQGPDRGSQYRSAIFYHSPEQKSIAVKVTAEVQEKHLKDKRIVTEIVPAGEFYDAETYHQVKTTYIADEHIVLSITFL